MTSSSNSKRRLIWVAVIAALIAVPMMFGCSPSGGSSKYLDWPTCWCACADEKLRNPDDALRMAITRRRPSSGLIHHSDHGSQYRSLLLGKTMREHGIRPSMGSVASPWDNAPTESFMGILKRECVHRRTFETREQAQLEIFEYIETFYNRLRMHSALGFMSPVEFEGKMAKAKEEGIVESAAKAA